MRVGYCLPRIALCLGLWAGCYDISAAAETLPGPADVGRIKPEESLPAPDRSRDQQIIVPQATPTLPVPETAKNIHFVLSGVLTEGVTAFPPEQLTDIYAPYLGKEVTLDVAYTIAEGVTKRYREKGYFLSLAYVPPQHIGNGVLKIKVVEGYISKLVLPEVLSRSNIFMGQIMHFLIPRPARSQDVESFLLRINDLPGMAFHAVLTPVEGGAPGAVRLTLEQTDKPSKGSITFDNFSSRFMGPNEVSSAYTTSILPMQQTTISGLSAIPVDKLRYGTIDQNITIAPDVALDITGGVTKAYPGFTLEPQDINSTASFVGVSLNYQYIRQRQENLSFKVAVDGRDVSSDIIDAPLTRERIRALRIGGNYDVIDNWEGANTASVTVSHGIPWLGASAQDSSYLSRAEAQPDFSKAELSLSRLQTITGNWSLFAAANGQYASGVLYSSEEFGYGGQAFGRAFDTSTITGDHGIAGSVELRYSGLSAWERATFQPYAFYDIGRVWNEAAGQPKIESGASAGFGMRFTTYWQQNGNLGLAWPLGRQITDPIYDRSTHGPRILLQIGQNFDINNYQLGRQTPKN